MSGHRLQSPSNFNSRPSARGDLAKGRCSVWLIFQFTPLREGRLRASIASSTAFLFQFTPLREGRQTPSTDDTPSEEFQFTPLREGRQSRNRVWRVCRDFNSRPSARGDWSSCGGTGAARLFQFTPLREGRRWRICRNPRGGIFQFTPLREGRPEGRACCRCTTNFNSRPSARGDAKGGINNG